jgi:hypothetical protein
LLRLRKRRDAGCGDWLGEAPPDNLVREPRRPHPLGPSATAMLDLPRGADYFIE